MTREQWHRWLGARLVTLTRVYFSFVFAWAIAHALFGDHWAWLFALNSFAEHFFTFLPAVVLIAFVMRQRETWIGAGITFALAAFLYGEMFVPKIAPTPTPSQTLTVMTYNMLGFTENPSAVIATIRASNADVVAIQELNPATAEILQRELIDYPYQSLAPAEGVTGLGVVSRLPMRANGETLQSQWLGEPQVLTLDWSGKSITLLHVHTIPSSAALLEYLTEGESMVQSVRAREDEIRALADYVNAHRDQPIIATGDFNMTDQNACYAIIAGTLRDAWREAGWGWGRTFPSTNFNTRTLPTIASMNPFMWLLRLDYVFHSSHWRAVAADLGTWDGQSDHRPVIVKLVLEKP